MNGTAGEFTVASYSGPGARRVYSRYSCVIQTLKFLNIGIRRGFPAIVEWIVGLVKISCCTHAEGDDYRTSGTAQVYAVDTGSVPSMIYWNGEDCCPTMESS